MEPWTLVVAGSNVASSPAKGALNQVSSEAPSPAVAGSNQVSDEAPSSAVRTIFKWRIDAFSSLLEKGVGNTNSNVFQMRGLNW